MTNVYCLFLQQKRVVMKKRTKMKSLMVIYKEMMLIADVIGMYKILNIYIYVKGKKKLMMLSFFVISLPIPPGAITSPFGFI